MGSRHENVSEPAAWEENEPNAVPSSMLTRVLLGYVIIIFPAVSFLLVTDFAPEWQSGSLSDYIGILLGGTAATYFSPFLIYSIICMFLLLGSRDKYSRYFLVRLGVYTGAILSLQYSILLALTSLKVLVGYSLGFWIYILLPWLHPRTRNWMKDRSIAGYAIVVALQMGGLAIFINRGEYYLFEEVFNVIISVFAVGPYVFLAIYMKTSKYLLRKYKLSKTMDKGHVFAAGLWGMSYIVVWRIAIVRTLEFYSELPLTPPSSGCYIVTAAARGNPTLVKSTPLQIKRGGIFLMNDQLRYLKCAELALKTISPWGHKQCRRMYDNYGRKLALKINTPTRAAAAYFSLKPFEWVSRMVMKLLIPNINEIADRLYTNPRSQ